MRVALVVAVLCAAASARATSVVVLPLPELRASADLVIHARVIAQRVAEEGGRAVTYTVLDVEDSLKGSKRGERLTVFQPGVLDGVRVQWITGAHVFHVGDDVVFFAKRVKHAGNDVIVAMTLGYGVFDVEQSAGGGRVVEEAGGAVDASTGATTSPRSFASLRDLSRALDAGAGEGDAGAGEGDAGAREGDAGAGEGDAGAREGDAGAREGALGAGAGALPAGTSR